MGQFEMKGLAPGRYRLTAQRNGFVLQAYGQRTPDGPVTMLTLSPGQKVSDIFFQLVPAAVITGHVYDEDGEPVLHAQVSAVYSIYSNGQRGLQGKSVEQTNDLGEYRLFGLPPGKYFVEATFPPTRRGDVKTDELYLPTFYPGVAEADRAAPVTVRGGDEFSGVDISLQRAPRMFAVRGHVSSSGCGAPDRGAIYVLLFPGQGFSSPPNLKFSYQRSGRI